MASQAQIIMVILWNDSNRCHVLYDSNTSRTYSWLLAPFTVHKFIASHEGIEVKQTTKDGQTLTYTKYS